MPRIPGLEAESRLGGSVNTSRVSVESASHSGRMIQKAGQLVTGVGDAAYQRQEQEEISKLNADLAAKQAEWAEYYDTDLMDGSLNHDEFMASYDEDIAKIKDQYSSKGAQEFFAKANLTMRNRFSENVRAGEVELAGNKEVESFTKAYKSNSSGLLRDPSSLDVVLKRNAELIDEKVRSGYLDYSKAQTLKSKGEQDLNVAALRGWIKRDPENTKIELQSGKWDILGADGVKQMLGEAEREIKDRKDDYDLAERRAKEAKQKKDLATKNSLYDGISDGSTTIKSIQESDLDYNDKEALKGILRKGDATEDPTVFTSLMKRAIAGNLDESEAESYFGNGLSLQGLRQIREEIQGGNSEQGKQEKELKKLLFQAAAAKLTKSNPLTGIKDSAGDQQMALFTLYVNEEMKKRKRENLPITDLFNPMSKDYLGHQIGSYVRSPTQAAQENIKAIQGPGATILPFDPNAKPKITFDPKIDKDAKSFLERKRKAEAAGK